MYEVGIRRINAAKEYMNLDVLYDNEGGYVCLLVVSLGLEGGMFFMGFVVIVSWNIG